MSGVHVEERSAEYARYVRPFHGESLSVPSTVQRCPNCGAEIPVSGSEAVFNRMKYGITSPQATYEYQDIRTTTPSNLDRRLAANLQGGVYIKNPAVVAHIPAATPPENAVVIDPVADAAKRNETFAAWTKRKASGLREEGNPVYPNPDAPLMF